MNVRALDPCGRERVAFLFATFAALACLRPVALAQEGLQRRLGDHEIAGDWIYGDWSRARELARKSGKPIFTVFRCVP